ncbi:hypothetical protein V1512DRAFT_255816 [Lipomyces arxii]|uniref:uncharacterized protein n=1 Tax=Lipomyces arxii TaxID=56418 RepID=UPI0034CE9FA1
MAEKKKRHFGRGGAGNVASEPVPDSSPAPVQVFTSPKQSFHSGRGGYGNIQSVDTLPTQTPEEYLQEVERAYTVQKGQVYKIGRGGVGNIFVEGKQDTIDDVLRKSKPANGEDQSEGLFSRLSRQFSRERSTSRDNKKESETVDTVKNNENTESKE